MLLDVDRFHKLHGKFGAVKKLKLDMKIAERSPSSAPPRGGSGNLPRRDTCPSPVPDGLQSPPGKAKAEQTFSSAAGSAAVFKGGRSHAVPALAT